VAGLAALRGVLHQAAVEQGEELFPYSKVADTLLRQQMAIFGSWSALRRRSARRWREGVWLDRWIRARLPREAARFQWSNEVVYRDYLHFGKIMGLSLERLPATCEEFNAWASSSLAAYSEQNYRRMALMAVTHLSPVFWPVNIALIFYLLPEDFWEVYGQALGKQSLRLAVFAERAITKLSRSYP
jgi:hypothetical protein